MRIKNKECLDKWLRDRVQLGHSFSSIKGKAPIGACYSDGETIVRDVNIAWRDDATLEVFPIEYEV